MVQRAGQHIDQTNTPPPTEPAARAGRSNREPYSRLNQLYHYHYGALAASIRKVFGDGPPDPDDVAQEAFRRLLERDDLSGIGNLPAFLWRTARNLVLSEKRSLKRRSKYDFEIEHLYFALESPDSDPESILDVKEQLLIIRRVLDNMSDRRRKALLWHRVDGLNFTEIGKRLGITRRAVARHVVKAAQELSAALHDAER